MTAISRSKVKIAILATGTNASAVATSDWISGEIKSYSKSGGDIDVESDHVFGGYVDKEKPRSQVELSFDIVPRIDSNALRWESIAYAVDPSSATTYTMNTSPTKRAVFIQAYDTASSKYISLAFNNCNVTMLDIEHNADDNRTYSLNMKFSPTTETGVSNLMVGSVIMTSLPNWTALSVA